MSGVLVAIDGTDSKRWKNKHGSNSHVYRFYRDFQGEKKYWDGPDVLGLECNSIKSSVLSFLRGKSGRVVMVGFSRGGLIAAAAADDFRGTVHYLGLYDAVDRALFISADRVSGNVAHCNHAVRDPKGGSWKEFGNCCMVADRRVDFRLRHFYASHAGIGGDPGGGPKCNVTLSQDRGGSSAADRFIRAGLCASGIPIAGAG